MPSSSPDRTGAGGPKPTFRLEARGADPDISIDVVDGWDRVVAGPAFERLAITLPRGPYVVRFRLGGGLKEMPILLSRDLAVDAPSMERASAAPIAGTSTSHEYYSGPAEAISRRTTGPAAGPDATGRLFLFVRAPDRERASSHAVGRGLRLVDTTGDVVASFDERERCERHDDWGWGAASLAVRPGRYSLCFDGPPARLVPLHVARDWQTQAFVLDTPGPAGGPRPETLRVFLRRGGFDPGDQLVRDVDAGYEALANFGDPSDTGSVPPSVVRWLLSEKFDDPMLGLLGAWLRLLSESRLPAYVIDNLESLVGPMPDIVALRIAAALRGGPVPPNGWNGPDEPPMLRLGLQALIEASADHPEAVPDGGIVDRLSPRLLSDLAFTSWTPTVASSAAAPQEIEDFEDGTGVVMEYLDVLGDDRHADVGNPDAGLLEGVDDGRPERFGVSTTGPRTRPDRLEASPPREITWVERALRDAGVTESSAASSSIPDLARRLSLPPSAIRRAIRGFGGKSDG